MQLCSSQAQHSAPCETSPSMNARTWNRLQSSSKPRQFQPGRAYSVSSSGNHATRQMSGDHPTSTERKKMLLFQGITITELHVHCTCIRIRCTVEVVDHSDCALHKLQPNACLSPPPPPSLVEKSLPALQAEAGDHQHMHACLPVPLMKQTLFGKAHLDPPPSALADASITGRLT